MTPTESIIVYKEEILATQIVDEATLDAFKNKWISKKGLIPLLFSEMRNIVAEEKKQFGEQINELKNLAEGLYEKYKVQFEEEALLKNKIQVDISRDGFPLTLGNSHPLSIIGDRLNSIFYNLGFVLAEGGEIVDDWLNFTALNMDENHPARDMQDTFFIQQNPDIVLRTHTSSVQIKTMQNQKPPIRIISPGRVFRKDNDSTHSPNFHQIEGLYIDKNVSFKDLKQTLFHFVNEMFGKDTEVRFRASFFPFTEPSAEMDILWKRTLPNGEIELRWMEILGCGMVDPQVLINCGIDPEQYSGFAFGIGIERIAMVKYGLSDIRLFYENDIRFLKQFKAEV